MLHRIQWLAVFCCLVVAATVAQAQAAPAGRIEMSGPVFWVNYGGPHICMVGDVLGEGRADFLGIWTAEKGALDWLRTRPEGKACGILHLRDDFGANALTAACGRFSRGKGDEVAALMPDGTVRAAWGYDPKTRRYQREEVAATVPPAARPAAPALAVAADLEGNGRPDILVVGADGKVLLLHNETDSPAKIHFAPALLATRLKGIRRLAAGMLPGPARASVVWLDGKGVVWRAVLEERAQPQPRLTQPVRVLTASPDDGLAVGRFRGAPQADLIVGRRFLPGGDASAAYDLPTLPDAATAATDAMWAAGDFAARGRDDLLIAHRGPDPEVGDDVVLYCSVDPGQAPPIADSSNDGLRDAWKTGAVKPGGLDLKAMGCSPQHRDVIVEVQPFDSVSISRVHREMERVVKYYASLPVSNLDGKPGIALHVIYRESISKAREGEHWGKLGGEFHPASHVGITHWMLIGSGGGGQSGQMAYRGSCGQAALYATFIHEFGHQLGLDHTGRWAPAWCPIYPSLMNYAYSYQLGGDPNKIGYSSGKLRKIVLNERDLSERLPVPIADVAFLAGPPYHYQLKATPDGKVTLIDWNWNDVLGEEHITADINYGYSTQAGARHKIGNCRTAAALVTHWAAGVPRLFLFAGDDKRGAKRDATAENDLRLYVRLWQGTDRDNEGEKWSPEQDIETGGVCGDPVGAFYHEATWLAYPTAKGINLRRVTINAAGLPQVGDAQLLPDSAGAQATLAPFAGRLAVILWRDADTPVGIRLATAAGTTLTVGPERQLPMRSRVPVGAAEAKERGAPPALWVALAEDQDPGRYNRWQVRKFLQREDGSFMERQREWLGGKTAGHRGDQRIVLLWEPSKDFPEGQLTYLQCGTFGAKGGQSCQYVGVRVKDQSVHHGWLVRRYYDEWSQSRSGPGACWFMGEMAYSMRWAGEPGTDGNGGLHVCFYGRGIDRDPMGDFDDISYIRDVGASHSIWNMEP